MDRKERPFSIVGDIKKAHRRFKHLAKEQGFLACQLDARSGGPARQLLRVHQQGGHLRQLLVDPRCSMRDKGHPPPAGTLRYCYLTALGYPFKWSKTRGGYRVEWLGMETEYSSYRLDLTEKRAGGVLREK